MPSKRSVSDSNIDGPRYRSPGRGRQRGRSRIRPRHALPWLPCSDATAPPSGSLPAILIGGVLVAAPLACSDDDSAAKETSTSSTASTSPPVTIPAGPSTVADRVLTQADVTSLPAAPVDLKVKAFEKVTTMQNPDPRAPCGAEITLPPFDGAAGVAVTGGELQGSEIVVPAGASAARAFVASMAGDTTVGCPPYTSTTSNGQKQTAVLTTVLPVEGLGDAATASLQQIKVGDTTGYALAVVVADGDDLALVNLFSSEPIDQRFAQALAGATAARLGGT